MGFWRVTVFLISLSYQGKTERVRCYCNLEECLSNNSSCFNEDGGCFSNFLDHRDFTQAEHGCLHLLKRERQDQCVLGSPSLSPKSLLLCCTGDMCNQKWTILNILTHSFIGSLINATEGQTSVEGSGNLDRHVYNTNEIWFRAATIAVPICGAMILFLFIALAFKVLRADHVNVEKYCGKGKSNANYSDSHIVSFKSGELNSKDLSKQIPLLYEMRQNERSENFRNFTSARIHFGQNVNILKEIGEDSSRTEKNLENAKINLEKPWIQRQNDSCPTTSNPESNNNNFSEDTSNSTLDVRVETGGGGSGCGEEDLKVLPTLSLNLDKSETLNSCNLYRSPRSDEVSSFALNLPEKTYEKYLL